MLGALPWWRPLPSGGTGSCAPATALMPTSRALERANGLSWLRSIQSEVPGTSSLRTGLVVCPPGLADLALKCWLLQRLDLKRVLGGRGGSGNARVCPGDGIPCHSPTSDWKSLLPSEAQFPRLQNKGKMRSHLAPSAGGSG